MAAITEKYGTEFNATPQPLEIIIALTNAQLFPHTRIAYESAGNFDNIMLQQKYR